MLQILNKDYPDLSVPTFKCLGHIRNRVFFTELHHRKGVNILDACLAHGDIVAVVNEPDGHAAYDALRQ